MKATTIKSFVYSGKALAVTTMFLLAGNMEAVPRFRGIEGTPGESDWIPRIIGQIFQIVKAISGNLQVPIG